MSKRIFHEAPVSIFKQIQGVTDGDYCLVHLMEQNQKYKEMFMHASHVQKREIILDNSLFELETPFDPERFCDWTQMLKPTWYIIPDKLEDARWTADSIANWNAKYKAGACGKSIGVAQGRSFNDLISCYLEIEPQVDMVAISFDYSMFNIPGMNKWKAFTEGRIHLINEMLDRGLVNVLKPHHLLGCSLPQEFIAYQKYDWIYSIDTSNPVVHGLYEVEYKESGLDDKQSKKLCDLIDAEVTPEQLQIIYNNVAKFAEFVNG